MYNEIDLIYGGLGLIIGVIVPPVYKKIKDLLGAAKNKIGQKTYDECKAFLINLAGLHPEDFAEDKLTDLLDSLDNKFGDHLSRATIKDLVDFVIKTVIADATKEIAK